MPLPGISFGGGGEGGFDFGDFKGGSINTGPLSIDARTTTGGGDPEILGAGGGLATVAIIAIVAFIAYKKFG